MSVKELKSFELSSMIKKGCQPKLRTTHESPEWFYDRPQSDRAVPSELDRPQSDRAKFRRVDRPQSDRANPIQRHPEPRSSTSLGPEDFFNRGLENVHER